MTASASLPTVQLGKDGPEVTALGFGAMRMSFPVGTEGKDEERFAVLDRAFELGCRSFDTADVYNDSEDLFGRWMKLRNNRSEIFLATKFSCRVSEAGVTFTSTPEYCLEACEKSLKRLGVDCIDLYYCHRVDRVTPVEKTIEAMVQLKNEGKIRYLGISECSENTLRRANSVHHIAAVQMEYSPFVTLIEDESMGVLKAARELGIALVAFSPLGKGFLSGQIKSLDDIPEDDYRRTFPWFSPENFPKNLELVHQITNLADKYKCTPSQLTLAWLMAQSTKDSPVIPIPGTQQIKYLEENVGGTAVHLNEDDVAEIRKLVDSIKANVKGDRSVGIVAEYAYGDTPPL